MVPVSEIKVCRSKAMTCDDFSAIANLQSVRFSLKILNIVFSVDSNTYSIPTITNVASRKVWFAVTLSIFTVRAVVESFVSKGSTVNLCVIDFSKAFDKLNLHALFIKLMKNSYRFNTVGWVY